MESEDILMDERLERAHVADVPAEFSIESASCALNQNLSSAARPILTAGNLHVDSMPRDQDADSESEAAFGNFEAGECTADCCKDDISSKPNKLYLRSTMSQQRLNHLMLLHIHKDRTNTLDLVSVVKEFISCNERRLSYFGND